MGTSDPDGAVIIAGGQSLLSNQLLDHGYILIVSAVFCCYIVLVVIMRMCMYMCTLQAMMDRGKAAELPKMQVGFIDAICMPLYEVGQ